VIFTSKIIPRYVETDQMGIVHHSVYAIWYEQARTEYFNSIGIRYDEIEKSGIITPLIELNCNYKKPAYYNQEIYIKTKLIELTPATFTVEYNIYDKDEELINIGVTKLVWADAKNFKITNLKRRNFEMYKKLEQLL
jgi:acyl-CoA thioester hydrolase